MSPRAILALLLVTLVTMPLSSALAGDPMPPEASLERAFPATDTYSPYAGRDFPTRPLWGDTHLHTSLSMDAGAFGARLMPNDAYRFAKGEELVSSTAIKSPRICPTLPNAHGS